MFTKDKEFLAQVVPDLKLETFGEKEISELGNDIDKVIKALVETPRALAVAANQVGISKRFFVVKFNLVKYPTASMKTLERFSKTNPEAFGTHIYLNPRFEIVNPFKTVKYLEGCLSEDKEHLVERFQKVIFTGLELRLLDGESAEIVPFKSRLKNLSAQIAQHEIDHLNGKGIWGKDEK